MRIFLLLVACVEKRSECIAWGCFDLHFLSVLYEIGAMAIRESISVVEK
jgi:hypothetical protein